jgi:hypothetical protein
MAAKNEAVFQGGLACIDTSTGLVAKGFVSTTLVPIGKFVEDSAAAANKVVLVELFREIEAMWFVNDGGAAVVAADIGGLAYILDDQTVSNTDATNTKSVAGRVWAIDTVKGVLVEPIFTAGQRVESGLDA